MMNEITPDGSLIGWATSPVAAGAAASQAGPGSGRSGPEYTAAGPRPEAAGHLAALLRRLLLTVVAACALVGLVPAPTALAATMTWSGNGPDGNWRTGSNWVGGVIPSAGDDLVFPAGSPRTAVNNNYATGTTFGSITFTGGGYTVFGNSFAVINGIADTSAVFHTNTIQPTISLIGNQTFKVNGAAAVLALISGVDVDVLSGVNQTAILTTDGDGTIVMGQLIGTFPSGQLVKHGSGTLTLVQDNPAFKSAIRVEEGILEARNPKSFGTADGGTLVREGAALQFTFAPDTTQTVAEPLTLFGTGPDGRSGALFVASGTTTYTGPIAPGSASTGIEVSEQQFLFIAGPVSTANNGSAVAGLKKLGNGQLILTGANTYAGTTTVSQGQLIVEHPQALGSASNGTVVTADGALTLTNRTGPPFFVSESLTLSGVGFNGQGVLGSRVGTSEWAGPITLAADAEIAAFSNGVLRVSGPIQGNGALGKRGDGVVTFLGIAPNTYTGKTTVGEGGLLVAKADGGTSSPHDVEVKQLANLPAIPSIVLAANNQIADNAIVTVVTPSIVDLNGHDDAIGGLSLTGARVKTFVGATPGGATGTLTLNGNVTVVQSGVGSVIAGKLSLGGATRSFSVANGAPGNDLDLTAVISNGGIAKNGDGTLRLSAANTYSGATSLGGGTLLTDGTQPASPITITGGRLGGGTTGPITTNNGTLDAGGIGQLPHGTLTTGAITLSSGATFGFSATGAQAAQQDSIIARGAVNPGNARLTPTIGFAPALGSVFTLIRNDSQVAVAGTFTGLAEGAKLTIGGQEFAISYRGGDGNDVTLTRGATPAPPTPTPPTPTPPTPTPPTPTPPTGPTPSACAPRPNVRVQTAPDGAGRLLVTVTAGIAPATPDNRLAEIRFRPGTNTLVDANGQTGITGAATVPLQGQPTSATFVVRKAQPNAPATLPFAVVDACGEFQTFVGGGPNAF